MCDGYAQIRRLKALNEVARLLRVGGQALVYVWAVEQQKDDVKSKYLRPSKTSAGTDSQLEMSPTTGEVPRLPVHVNGTAFKAQDMLVPWHLKKASGAAEQIHQEHDTPMVDSNMVATSDEFSEAKNPQILHRYYHTFVDGELQRLCKLVAGVRVVNAYYDQGNWCIVVERTTDTKDTEV